MTTISVRDFGWRYATRNSPALKTVSFDIHSGERVLILGASGSGKSTLLKAIAGVLGEDEGVQTGDILIDGISSRKARGLCGLVLQDPTSNIILERIGDEVAFGLENLGVPADEIWPRVRRALEVVGLEREPSDSTSKLSGGQMQRLAIASVLAMDPRVLAFDEPTSNLDPEGVRQLTATLTSVLENRDTPVVIVEHRVDTWWDFATRIIVLGPGGVIWDGAPHTLPKDVAKQLESGGVWLPHTLRTTSIPHRGHSFPNPLQVLSTHCVEAGYLPGSSATQAVTAEFTQGRIYAITGSNGSGKTALALSLAGLLPVVSGDVIAEPLLAGSCGVNPAQWKSAQLLSRIGFVFQSPENQFVANTVAKELAVGPRALKLSEQEVSQRVQDLLRTLNLEDLAEVHPFTLSGGQQRRLSVATALATAPQVLICDEPTFGQDANTWRQLVELFLELRQAGHCLIVVTHDEDLISAVADDVLVMDGVHELH